MSAEGFLQLETEKIRPLNGPSVYVNAACPGQPGSPQNATYILKSVIPEAQKSSERYVYSELCDFVGPKVSKYVIKNIYIYIFG